MIFQVKGMSCAHCEKHVSDAVRKIQGVKSCKANAAEGTVSVSLKPGVSAAEAIKAAITEAGYEVAD